LRPFPVLGSECLFSPNFFDGGPARFCFPIFSEGALWTGQDIPPLLCHSSSPFCFRLISSSDTPHCRTPPVSLVLSFPFKVSPRGISCTQPAIPFPLPFLISPALNFVMRRFCRHFLWFPVRAEIGFCTFCKAGSVRPHSLPFLSHRGEPVTSLALLTQLMLLQASASAKPSMPFLTPPPLRIIPVSSVLTEVIVSRLNPLPKHHD